MTNELICAVCSSTFIPAKFQKGRQKYCSAKCRNKESNFRNREYKSKWSEENRDRVLESQKKWLTNNPEKRKESSERYRTSNKSYYSAKSVEYTSRKRRAVPPWADLELIELIYAECRENCEVDHIIPLKGKNVCGLHTQENLQYLPMSLNRRKSNKLNEDVNAVIHSDAFSDDRSDQ